MNASSDQISVRRYVDPIRGFAPLVVIATIIGALLGLAAHTIAGATYTSTVTVLVSPISGDPVDGLGTSVVDVDMATEAEVATSVVVAERANDLLAGQPPAKDPRDLLDQVETSVRGTRIIEMTFAASEPEIARRGAEAFAEAFLSYREELAMSQLEVSNGRLADRIAQLQLELTDVSTRRAAVPEIERDGAAYAALVINEQTLLDELSINQSRLADLRGVITDDAVVLDTASLPRAASSLGWMTFVVGGAAAGFVLGAGVALMLDAARRRSEDEELAVATAAKRLLTGAGADLAVATPAVPAPTAPAMAPSPTIPDVASAWDAPHAAPAVQPDAAPDESHFQQAPLDPGDHLDSPVDRWGPDAAAVPEPAPSAWGDLAAGESAEPAWRSPDPSDGDLGDGADEALDAIPEPFGALRGEAPPTDTPMPDPFAVADQVWEGSETTAAADHWGSAPFVPTGEAPAREVPVADDPWGAPLSGSDEDTWASIVEAAGGEADPSTDAPGDVSGSAAPLDLDGLLQERARESVAQLGDHLTRAVDTDRRAVVVVDGGDGSAVPVAVAMAAHLAAAGRRTLLVDPRGDALAAAAPGRYDVRDHPTLEVLVGDTASDHMALVADAAGDGTMVVFAGAAIESPLVAADGDWAGAIVIATTGVANPASIPDDTFERVMSSRHPLIGIVSIMARPAMAPPSR